MKISARDLDAIMRKSVGTRELGGDDKVVQSYTASIKDFKPVSAKSIKKSFSDINEFSIKQFRNSNLNKSINEVRKYAAMIIDNKMNLKDALDKLPNNMRDDLFSELRKIRGSKK
tara:strand:+ start:349 stop:693 length:345 start_codon:yes stop_codon:yes gene_type:complete